jgi:CHAT domain-containing protein/tetratricopeptide (TPR) repeat protein
MRFPAAAALIASIVFSSFSNADTTLPPRSASDVVAMLHAAPVRADETAAARQVLAEPVAEGLSGRALANAHLQRARAAEMLGLNNVYLAEYRAAWEASGRSSEPENTQLRVEYTAAEVHSGNMMAALLAHEETARRGLVGTQMASHAFLAENKARHGDLEGARENLRQAESNYVMLQRSPLWAVWGYAWESNIERARGGVALGQGKFAEAENHFRKSADLRERDIPQNQARLDAGRGTISQKIVLGLALMAHRGVADMLLMQGRLVEAEMLYREIIARANKEFGNGSPLMLLYIEGLIRVLFEQGRSTDARDLAIATLELLQKQGMAPESRVMTATRLRLAAAYASLEQWQLAFEQYEAVRVVLEKDAELNSRLGRGNKGWALTLMHVGQPAAAVKMMENLLADDVRRFSDDDRNLGETRGFYAMALAESGRDVEALVQFRRAVNVLLLAQQDAGEEGATASMRRGVKVLEAYLDLLYKLHLKKAGPADIDIPAEAFRVADVARGSAVQKALLASAARSAIHDPKLAQLARDEQDLSRRIAVLNDTLSRLLSSPPDQRLEKIIADIRRDIPLFKAERKRLREQIDKEFPEYSILINPKPLSPVDVQGLLKADEAMLAIYSGVRRTYLWGIPKSGAPVFAVSELGAGAVGERVARIRRGLDLGSSMNLEAEFDLAAAHELYAQMVQPVAAGALTTGVQHLLVVPHGALGQLPFALLPTQAVKPGKAGLPFDTYAKVPWLIGDVALSQLPSVSTLLALRRVTPVRAGGRSPFIGFGDPWFNARHAAQQNTEEHAHIKLAGRSIGVRFGPGTRSASSASIADLARLPDTAQEMREIAGALKVNAAEAVHLGREASESAVKASNLTSYRIVAFATHGLVPGDLNGLVQPALALSNPELTGEKDADGLLTMEEILGLSMNADWVVLSACNTATGDGSSSEAVSGLGRAFFYAGTRALLVTNWPVETVSARLLTTELFLRQAEQPALSRAQALRSAMLSVMQQKALNERTGKPDYSYAHPLFWAPYALVGDGGN